MNDPYPSPAQLRAESLADGLLAAQAAAAKVFHEALALFLRAVRPLEFPLGSPCLHYDWEDVCSTAEDWQKPAREDGLEQQAMDLARDLV